MTGEWAQRMTEEMTSEAEIGASVGALRSAIARLPFLLSRFERAKDAEMRAQRAEEIRLASWAFADVADELVELTALEEEEEEEGKGAEQR